MYKGLIILIAVAVATMTWSHPLYAQVYKVVDENGNVTYTDQPPENGAEPMDLPEISVVETDTAAPVTLDSQQENESDSPQNLRRMFRDFQILSPGQDESLWGTGNTVVVSWGASEPYRPGMSVSVVVDGQSQDADPDSNLSITLERGEHEVYAILRDQNGRQIVTTPRVTFYMHQASRLINPG